MTYGEFLKIPQKIKKIKVKTVTYWVTGKSGGDFKGGFYFFRVVTLKVNGKYEIEFLSVEKVNNDGKHISYVIPTRKNCPIVG